LRGSCGASAFRRGVGSAHRVRLCAVRGLAVRVPFVRSECVRGYPSLFCERGENGRVTPPLPNFVYVN
jgi:hypothetical protein